ncbi:MAG: hypothetical protein RBR77_11465 [Thauera sp.]|nr:hypothetical protein [Thauera sp.]
MKKKLLASVVAGFGLVGSAQAVHVNADGLGQVLLYPYYTVQDGADTYVHIVNTTNESKAVKVRFLEGKNSREVLDFNLYLSPFDEWTGVIVRTANGAALKTTDTSCTAPAIPAAGVEFRNFEYVGDSVNGTDRSREGYLEVIEMGVVRNATLERAITHVNGVPGDCAAVRNAARAGAEFNTGAVVAPTGGLYGFNTLINVDAGLASTVDAIALDDFFDPIGGGRHTPSGSLLPSLAQVDTTADIIDGATVHSLDFARAIDNVSALITRTDVINDYVIAPEIDAITDWVVTFPTKRFYVNSTNPAPFQNVWSATTSTSCDEISVTYFDREEGTKGLDPDDFSPQPVIPGISLCNEVNTVSIVARGDSASLYGAEFTAAKVELDSGFTSGWMRIDFTSANALAGITDVGGTNVVGLPVVGFSGMGFTNGTLTVDGVNVLSNYSGISTHKGHRIIR